MQLWLLFALPIIPQCVLLLSMCSPTAAGDVAGDDTGKAAGHGSVDNAAVTQRRSSSGSGSEQPRVSNKKACRRRLSWDSQLRLQIVWLLVYFTALGAPHALLWSLARLRTCTVPCRAIPDVSVRATPDSYLCTSLHWVRLTPLYGTLQDQGLARDPAERATPDVSVHPASRWLRTLCFKMCQYIKLQDGCVHCVSRCVRTLSSKMCQDPRLQHVSLARGCRQHHCASLSVGNNNSVLVSNAPFAGSLTAAQSAPSMQHN